MKRIRIAAWMVVTMLSIMALTACDREDGRIKPLGVENYAVDPNERFTLYNYEGEWTVDKQVVETARLSIRNDLAIAMLEFPVVYLSNLFFQKEDSLIVTQWHQYPFYLSEQAVSEQAKYYSLMPQDFSDRSELGIGEFQVTKNFTRKFVALMTNGMGNGIYRLDTGLWTISISISSYVITDGATGEASLCHLPEPITLYYNAKKKVE